MTNPVCLSPLKFYDDIAKQCHRKSYAHGHISPLITRLQYIPAFQFVVSSEFSNLDDYAIREAYFIDAKTDRRISNNIVSDLTETGLTIIEQDGHKVVIYFGLLPIQIEKEGQQYLELIFGPSADDKRESYYSEIFCFTNYTDDCLEIEYWNETGNFYIKNGIVVFPDKFHFKLLLKSEIGKPDYNFEEEGTKRLGYNFIESQVSKKVYKFNTVVPEFICDAMRIIRLCDNVIIRSFSNEHEAITFDMDVDWQTQGDLASVTCEFETDNVIANLGGFAIDRIMRGDYNNDYNDDYDNMSE